MNFIVDTDDEYEQIIKNGTFYYPAWKHYGRIANVVCDKCLKNNLISCVGYVNKDLCLQCVDFITKRNQHHISIIHPVTHIVEPIFRDSGNRDIKDLCDEVRHIKPN